MDGEIAKVLSPISCQGDLHEAVQKIVEHCDVDMVRNILHQRSIDFVKIELIVAAARYGKEGILNYVINEGAGVNVNHGNNKRNTALTEAARFDHSNCVHMLLDAGADVNVINNLGYPPLILAAENGHDSIVSALLEAGASVNTEDTTYGDLVLTWALRCSQYQCAEMLIKAGADVNRVSRNGVTPLSVALVKADDECLGLLLRSGANMEYIVERSSALTDVANCGRYDRLAFMIEAGADVNKPTYTGIPLYVAIRGGKECVAVLLGAGADVNGLQPDGSTALITAADIGSDSCVDLLIKAGADVNTMDKSGKTALMWAAERAHLKCIESLIKAGADVNAMPHNYTALHMATLGNNNKCVDLLIKSGADVNVSNAHVNPALMWVAMSHNYKSIRSLIQAGADVNFVDSSNSTVMMNVVVDLNKGNTHNIVKLLLKQGANVNIINHDGHNASKYHIFMNYVKPNRQLLLLLFTAGEMDDGIPVGPLNISLSRYLPQTKPRKLILKRICREAIRRHLLNLNPHENLFLRIPHLGLSSLLTKYLLYNMSLKKT